MKVATTITTMVLTLALAGCGDASPGPDDETGHAKKEAGHERSESGTEHGDHNEEAGSKVSLTSEQSALLNLKTDKVPGGRADQTIQVPASAHFNADRIAHVGPLLSGRVEKVVADLGDRVEPGDPLAVLSSPRLGQVKARYLRKQAEFEAAAADLRRQSRLAKQNIVSQADLLDTRALYRGARAERNAAKAALRAMGLTAEQIAALDQNDDLSRYVLTSPLAGVVEERDLAPGQILSTEQTPIMVVDASSLWVFGQVYEKNADLVAVGQPARFDTVDAAVDGKIDWVASRLDRETRTLKVRALIDNSSHNIKAGQYGDLTITRQVADPVPLVPVDAVQTINGQTHVFVPGDKDDEYRAQEVQTGEEANGLIEIKSGLQIGASVVTSGAFDLKSALTASGRSAAHGH